MQDQYMYDLIYTMHKKLKGRWDSCANIDMAVREVLSEAPNLPRELTDNELIIGMKREKQCAV